MINFEYKCGQIVILKNGKRLKIVKVNDLNKYEAIDSYGNEYWIKEIDINHEETNNMNNKKSTNKNKIIKLEIINGKLIGVRENGKSDIEIKNIGRIVPIMIEHA